MYTVTIDTVFRLKTDTTLVSVPSDLDLLNPNTIYAAESPTNTTTIGVGNYNIGN